MFRKISELVIVIYALCMSVCLADVIPSQSIEELKVTKERFATVEVQTDFGEFEYHLDNTGECEVSAALQAIFDEIGALENASATFTFLPGVYFIDAPVSLKMVCVELVGTGHGGLDVHGANLKSGTIFRFGKNTGPNCFTFLKGEHTKAFPSGKSPWNVKNSKVAVQGMTFMGYNNTGVNTADGYSRFFGDTPNFRGLSWYPAKDRYADPEKEGQRALVFPKGSGKFEMFRVNNCVFTELYAGIDADFCDVCFITDSWFAQMAYGIRIKGAAPVAMIKNNCFADLETGVVLGSPKIANLNGNGFAYVSKCFTIKSIQHSTINNNSVENWHLSTGAAAHGAFCHIGSSENLVMMGNSICQAIDSRAKTTTVDEKPNGRAFINIENSKRLMFANNVINTVQTQTVVRLHNVSDSVIVDNIITYGKGGSAVAQTGNCSGNYYRKPAPNNSEAFDEYKQ